MKMDKILQDTENGPGDNPSDSSRNPVTGNDPVDGDEVIVGELEVGGVLVDREGNKWAVPAGNVEDIADLHAGDPLRIPDPDPNFHYQFIRRDKVQIYLTNGWGLVTKKEIGFSVEVLQEFGQSTTSYHEVGDAVLMKKPKVLVDAINRAKNKRAREALNAMEPTEDMIRNAQERGFPVRVKRDSSVGGFTATGEKE